MGSGSAPSENNLVETRSETELAEAATRAGDESVAARIGGGLGGIEVLTARNLAVTPTGRDLSGNFDVAPLGRNPIEVQSVHGPAVTPSGQCPAGTQFELSLPFKILDLVPVLAYPFFQGEIPVTLSPVQASVLFCIGMQNQDISHIKEEMKLEREQILSLFIKVMKKLYKYLYSAATKEIDATLPRLREVTLAPHSISVDEDLNEAAMEVRENMKADNQGILKPELLQRYAIVDRESDFEKALQSGAGKVSSSGLVSVKSSKLKMENGVHKAAKKKREENSGERSNASKKNRN